MIEDRDERASTMLISQRPIADWYEFVGEDLLADAFLDRVRNRTHRIQLEGKSKRG
ncbi:MAG: ATP-binding protein [Paracoccus sp. (in: a-proteobacteria)]